MKSPVLTGVFATLRLAERLLPRPALRAVLWPAAALLVLAQRAHRAKLRRALDRFPERLRPGGIEFLFLQPARAHLDRFLAFWPDRLPAPRWVSRCRMTGFTGWVGKPGPPVVLVSFHVGPCVLLPYWLRALGIPAATLVGPLRERSELRRRRHRLAPMPDVPMVFASDEVRPTLKFLAAGHTLLVLIDVPRGRQADVPLDGLTFRVATRALRMAAKAGALVVPCLIVETEPWRFTIHCGAPVPAHLLQPERSGEAAAHVLGELMPLIRRHPEQCEPDFLESIVSRAP